EVDFPRIYAKDFDENKADGKSSKTRKRKLNERDVSDEVDPKANESKRTQFAGVWHTRITPSLLTEGVLGLGVVREIHDDKVELESADGVLVTLPATNISDQLSATLKSSSFTLADIFVPGQMIAYKVLSAANATVSRGKKQGGSRRAVVTCCPSVVNAHLMASSLLNGLVLNGSVESVEDKGVVINFGLQSCELRGFLPSTALPQFVNMETLIHGQVLLIRIQHLSPIGKVGRVINVSAIPEVENLDERIVEKLHLNMLMPGTILLAEPIQSTAKGVYVELGNGVKGFIRKQHLPPRQRRDLSKLIRSIRVVVMFCEQNSRMLVLSAHPDIVALSKPQKRNTFEGIAIGDKVLCEVNEVDRFGNIHFDLILDNAPKGSLVSAYATKSHLQSANERDAYKPGSVHQVRVISYRLVERQLVVSNKREIFAQKMVSLVDAVPGEKIRAKIESIKANGLGVKVYDRISAFIPIVHIADKQFTRIEKHYSKGQVLDCRILEVDALKRRLILTSKPSLLNSSLKLIKEYSAENVGAVTLGYVRAKHENGGLLIGFYGGVRAYMFPKEAARLGEVKLGYTIQVNVQSVDVEKQRMLVTVADPSLTADTVVLRSSAFMEGKDVPLCYSATITGNSQVVSGAKRGQRLDLNVHLGKKLGGTVQTSMAVELLSDTLDPLVDTLADCFKVGSKIPQVTVLSEKGGIIKVSSKRFVIDWLQRHPRIHSMDDLSKGLLVCGTVTQRHAEMGYFVELAGGSALVAPARFIVYSAEEDPQNEVQIGQTVLARVSSIDIERKRFSLILNPPLCYELDDGENWCSLGLRLLEYTIADWEWCAANLIGGKKLPSLGASVDVTLVLPLNDALTLEWSDEKLRGYARKGNFPERKYTRGETLKALLLDVVLPSCELEFYIFDEEKESTSHSAKTKKGHTKRKKVELCSEVEVCVAAVKRDFIATVTVEDSFERAVIYLPSRFHPNIVTPSPPTGRLECGAVCKVMVKQLCGSTLIGLAEGDLAFATALLSAKMKTKQDLKKKKKRDTDSTSKRVKPFMVYPAKVVGPWKRGQESACAIELELPGGILGRLHGSELDESLLENERYPIGAFLREKTAKSIYVKVISFGSIKEITSPKVDLSKPTKKRSNDDNRIITSFVRVAECTMRKWKMAEEKKKQSLLGYQQHYVHGELVTVFVKKPLIGGILQVEASPITAGVIQKQSLGEGNLTLNPTDTDSALIDAAFEPGEVMKARVVGVSTAKNRRRSRQQKCLELTVVGSSNEVKPDERVMGRVINITQSPTSVVFALANSQRAVITPTGVSDRYGHALED
uniref:S1 motif domain-containing protein n=2 Tax=Parascaris univalens TaxID=6257 RepID=A0A915BAG2_PARUN